MDTSKNNDIFAVKFGYVRHEPYFDTDALLEEVRDFAKGEHLAITNQALDYMEKQHKGQFRKKSRFSDVKVPYINHPLMMACHMRALGISYDALMAVALLHDVVEDTGVTLDELPFDDEVKRMVGLLTFTQPEGQTRAEAKAVYYDKMAFDDRVVFVKLLDRCNNVATMVSAFTPEKLDEYIRETETFIFPLADAIIRKHTILSGPTTVLKYHMISVIETIKCMRVSED